MLNLLGVLGAPVLRPLLSLEEIRAVPSKVRAVFVGQRDLVAPAQFGTRHLA